MQGCAAIPARVLRARFAVLGAFCVVGCRLEAARGEVGSGVEARPQNEKGQEVRS